MNTPRLQDASQPVRIPPELQRSIPRDVVLSRAGKAMAGIAIAMLIGAVALGVALYVTAVRDATRYRAVERQSAVVQGRVTALGPVRDGKRAVSYSFEVDGREYDGRTTLQTRYWRALPVGATLPVRYLTANPTENWMLGHESRGVPFWVVAVAPLSLLFTPVLVAFMLRRQRALLAEGRPALARVTRVKRIQGHGVVAQGLKYEAFQARRKNGYRVWYEFNDLSGAKHSGRANMGAVPPAEGSSMVILYNSDEPQRSAPYPLQNVRVSSE